MKAELGGIDLFYDENGDKARTPVIFLHGFPFDRTMWKGQLGAVGRLHRAIAYDIRGHGQSGVGDGQYMIEGHVEDLFAFMDHLRIRQTVIVGLSMGGYIALRALEKQPDRFLGVVLSNTRSEADSNEGKLKRFAGMTLAKTKGSAAFAAGFVPALFAPGTEKSRQAERDEIARVVSATPPLSIAGTLIALAARTDTTPSLAAIKVPTLIMVGEADQLTPPAASEAMHERIPGSELFIVPGAAHLSNLENPDFFNEKLLSFLKRIAEKSPGQK